MGNTIMLRVGVGLIDFALAEEVDLDADGLVCGT
jgi:hypothetical protein